MGRQAATTKKQILAAKQLVERAIRRNSFLHGSYLIELPVWENCGGNDKLLKLTVAADSLNEYHPRTTITAVIGPRGGVTRMTEENYYH